MGIFMVETCLVILPHFWIAFSHSMPLAEIPAHVEGECILVYSVSAKSFRSAAVRNRTFCRRYSVQESPRQNALRTANQSGAER